MTDCANVFVALDFKMEDAKKPPTQRLTANTQAPCPEIVFNAGEVEAHATAQGFGVGFFDRPQFEEGNKSGILAG
jgi:hypothetical protein